MPTITEAEYNKQFHDFLKTQSHNCTSYFSYVGWVSEQHRLFKHLLLKKNIAVDPYPDPPRLSFGEWERDLSKRSAVGLSNQDGKMGDV